VCEGEATPVGLDRRAWTPAPGELFLNTETRKLEVGGGGATRFPAD
jgi:hypothetical protein